MPRLNSQIVPEIQITKDNSSAVRVHYGYMTKQQLRQACQVLEDQPSSSLHHHGLLVQFLKLKFHQFWNTFDEVDLLGECSRRGYSGLYRATKGSMVTVLINDDVMEESMMKHGGKTCLDLIDELRLNHGKKFLDNARKYVLINAFVEMERPEWRKRQPGYLVWDSQQNPARPVLHKDAVPGVNRTADMPQIPTSQKDDGVHRQNKSEDGQIQHNPGEHTVSRNLRPRTMNPQGNREDGQIQTTNPATLDHLGTGLATGAKSNLQAPRPDLSLMTAVQPSLTNLVRPMNRAQESMRNYMSTYNNCSSPSRVAQAQQQVNLSPQPSQSPKNRKPPTVVGPQRNLRATSEPLEAAYPRLNIQQSVTPPPTNRPRPNHLPTPSTSTLSSPIIPGQYKSTPQRRTPIIIAKHTSPISRLSSLAPRTSAYNQASPLPEDEDEMSTNPWHGWHENLLAFAAGHYLRKRNHLRNSPSDHHDTYPTIQKSLEDIVNELNHILGGPQRRAHILKTELKREYVQGYNYVGEDFDLVFHDRALGMGELCRMPGCRIGEGDERGRGRGRGEEGLSVAEI